MVWAFQRILSGKFYNPDDKAEFQAELYKNVDPKNAKAIISVNHRPNCSMNKIITSANRLTIHFLRRNDIYNSVLTF